MLKLQGGVTILTHGYDWSVLAGLHDIVLGSAGKVKIGNNVFIGMNSTILKGVTIGDNVIVGAASLVNKDIPSNCVAVGNPCRVIMQIDEYYKKRKELQFSEALDIYKSYIEVYNQDPPEEIFNEFFWLFYRKEEELLNVFKKQMGWHGRAKETYENLIHQTPMFNGYEKFLAALKAEI